MGWEVIAKGHLIGWDCPPGTMTVFQWFPKRGSQNSSVTPKVTATCTQV